MSESSRARPDTTRPRPARLRTKLLAAALAVGLALAMCEGLTRLVFPAPPDPAKEPLIKYQADPNVGFIQSPNQSGYLDEGLATINGLGLRGPMPELPKPAGAQRVLAIGDSTTFGWGVNDADTYVAQLGQMMRNARRPTDVVNGGVGAYDLRHEVWLLKHFAPSLQPDVVIVGFLWNDLAYEAGPPDAGSLTIAPIFPPKVDSNAPVKPFFIGNQPSRLNQLLRRSRLLYVLRQAYLSFVAPTGVAAGVVQWEMALLEGQKSGAIDDAWRDIDASFAEIRSLADEAGFEVGVLIMPIRAQVEKDFPRADYQARVRQLAEQQRFFVVDPLPKFRAEVDRKSLFIPYDRIHFSPKGNQVIAQAVYDVLRGREQ